MFCLVGVDEVGSEVVWRPDHDEVAFDDIDIEVTQICEGGLGKSEYSMEVDSVKLVYRPDFK